ncbi:MAG: hypothetical protein IJY39_04120 [Clostridia bacterium]|nr:hypothetical protein [Clostridia bacterium]
MRIHVNANGRRINLILPTAVVLNRLTAQLMADKARSAAMENAGVSITLTGAQLGRLFRAIKRCRKKYPDWVLVEVKAHKGEEVTIKL